MMKKITIVLQLVVVIGLSCGLTNADDYDKEFTEWLNQYKGSSVRALGNYNIAERKKIWTQTHLNILKHNERYKKGLETYTQAHNQYSDLTPKEFRGRFFGHKPSPIKGRVAKYKLSGRKNAATVDWVKKGYVNTAKSQGNCGSCYVFAAVNSLEGQVKRYFNQLPILSTQQVTSCGGRGCDGGNAGVVYNYLNTSAGIMMETDYPYTSGETSNNAGTCQSKSPIDSRLVIAKVLGTEIVVDESTTESETLLVDAIATVGPISVGIFASGPGFQSYSSGVYSCSSCSTEANHDVTAVGYGTDPVTGKDYFALMNSWGTSWGMDGVVWIERNKNFMIGIGKQGYYPLIDTSYAPPSVIKPPTPQDIKTDSVILKSKEDDMLISTSGAANLTLIYRASRDGFKSSDFHEKCDDKINTIVLIKPKSLNYVFGGFAARGWDSSFKWLRDPEAYLFSLRRNGVSELEKFAINSAFEGYALRGGSSTAFQFGNNLIIRDGSDKNSFNLMGANCKVYKCPSDAMSNDADVILTGKNGGFQVQDIEVFEINYAMNS